MTDTNDDAAKKAEEAKKLHDQQIVDAYKGLAATGFSKEQAAQQLSAKYAMTVDEVTAIIADVDPDEKTKEKTTKNKDKDAT